MTCAVDEARAPRLVYRLGFKPDAWEWPDWRYVGNGRWDDPGRDYRVLYASTDRLTTFIEVMGNFQADPLLEADMVLIDGDDAGATPPGAAPTGWLPSRSMGTARIRGRFAAVGRARSLRFLQERFGAVAAFRGVPQIDGAAIRQTAPDSVTQMISGFLRICRRAARRQFSGIFYLSRHGDEFENWAIFEPCARRRRGNADIDEADADYQRAIDILGLRRP
jgi:hypothetical protein